MKSVVFRVDASIRIASGHIMRCLTLGDTLKGRKYKTFFICRDLPGNFFNVIKQRGHRVIRLAAPKRYSGTGRLNDYAASLGVSWKQDARETIHAICKLGLKPDWLVLDHYALERGWESMLRPLVKKILVIDDLAINHHECNLLLNENFLPHWNEAYKTLLSKETEVLAGPKYALIRPEFIKMRKKRKPWSGFIRRILIYYGAADPTNETEKALNAVLCLDRRDFMIDVVIGQANPHRKSLLARREKMPRVTLHTQRPHLAYLMARADLAMSAGGSTIWELLYMGVPAFVTTTADNQVQNIRQLHEKGFIYWLGQAESVRVDDLKNALERAFAQGKKLRMRIEKGKKIVEGNGVLRIVAAMGQI